MLLPWLVARIGARAFYVAALLPIAAFVQAAIQTPAVIAGDIPFEAFDWIPPLGIELSMRMDTLSWLMALIVTGVGALVMLYCRWYFRGKTEGLGQFAAVLLAFAGAMYGLVLTDDLVVLVMFWELTSVLSYLLIGYYNRRAASRRAALQALLVTTLGGLVMLIGVVLLVVDAGTSSISTILAEAPTGPIVDAALVLLLVGALSKSAIFPFHFWLPGAMAAPTPVSAYLHAAAMVKAGIYLIARLAPVFADRADLAADRDRARRVHDAARRVPGAARDRPQARPRVRHGEPARPPRRRPRLRHRDAALAGLALLLSHALFKSALFLVVGVIDRQLSTRDIGELSGVGRQAPVMATFSIIAVASMVGHHPDDRIRREGGRPHRAAARGRGRLALGDRRPRRRRSSDPSSRRHTASASCGARSGRRQDAATARRASAPSGPTRRSASSARPSCCRRSPSSPASPRRCSTSPSRRTPTRRRPRHPA